MGQRVSAMAVELMIHEVEGDILDTKAAAIAHGVAANDPMTQGLAAALH